jgi:DNA-binding GntR family transcriptional regulator
MGEVLMKDETPRDIWDQHAEILQAVANGDAAQAEALARGHITQAADFMVARLESERQPDRA